MTETVQKFIPIFVGLLLILRGLFWIIDGKNGNKRGYFFGIAAIMVGIIMFIMGICSEKRKGIISVDL